MTRKPIYQAPDDDYVIEEQHGTLPMPAEELLAYSYDVLDKQYRLYGWFDTKMQSMLTINGAAAAAVTFLLKDESFLINDFSQISLYISLLFLVGSLLVILFHAIPMMDSGVSTETGTRSLVHIVRISKDEYFNKIAGTSKDDILRLNCQQISGMARNNVQSNRILRYSAMCSFIGISALFLSLAFGAWFGDLSGVAPEPIGVGRPAQESIATLAPEDSSEDDPVNAAKWGRPSVILHEAGSNIIDTGSVDQDDKQGSYDQ